MGRLTITVKKIEESDDTELETTEREEVNNHKEALKLITFILYYAYYNTFEEPLNEHLYQQILDVQSEKSSMSFAVTLGEMLKAMNKQSERIEEDSKETKNTEETTNHEKNRHVISELSRMMAEELEGDLFERLHSGVIRKANTILKDQVVNRIREAAENGINSDINSLDGEPGETRYPILTQKNYEELSELHRKLNREKYVYIILALKTISANVEGHNNNLLYKLTLLNEYHLTKNSIRPDPQKLYEEANLAYIKKTRIQAGSSFSKPYLITINLNKDYLGVSVNKAGFIDGLIPTGLFAKAEPKKGHFGVYVDNAGFIANLDPDGVFAKAGLKVDDRLVSFDNIKDVKDLTDKISSNTKDIVKVSIVLKGNNVSSNTMSEMKITLFGARKTRNDIAKMRAGPLHNGFSNNIIVEFIKPRTEHKDSLNCDITINTTGIITKLPDTSILRSCGLLIGDKVVTTTNNDDLTSHLSSITDNEKGKLRVQVISLEDAARAEKEAAVARAMAAVRAAVVAARAARAAKAMAAKAMAVVRAPAPASAPAPAAGMRRNGLSSWAAAMGAARAGQGFGSVWGVDDPFDVAKTRAAVAAEEEERAREAARQEAVRVAEEARVAAEAVAAKAKAEAERLAAERADEEAKAKAEAARLAAEAEAKRLAAVAADEEAKAKAEAARLAAEAEAKRLAAVAAEAKANAEKEKREREARAAEERLAAERVAAEKVEAENVAALAVHLRRLAAERVAADKAVADKAAADKAAAEKAAAERAAAERARAAEKAAVEKAAVEAKAKEERAAADKEKAEAETERKEFRDDLGEATKGWPKGRHQTTMATMAEAMAAALKEADVLYEEARAEAKADAEKEAKHIDLTIQAIRDANMSTKRVALAESRAESKDSLVASLVARDTTPTSKTVENAIARSRDQVEAEATVKEARVEERKAMAAMMAARTALFAAAQKRRQQLGKQVKALEKVLDEAGEKAVEKAVTSLAVKKEEKRKITESLKTMELLARNALKEALREADAADYAVRESINGEAKKAEGMIGYVVFGAAEKVMEVARGAREAAQEKYEDAIIAVLNVYEKVVAYTG